MHKKHISFRLSLLAVMLTFITVAGISIGRKGPGRDVFINVQKHEDGTFSLQAKDVQKREVVQHLEKAAGIQIELDSKLASEKVTLNLQDMRVEDMLAELTPSQAMIFEKEGDTYRLVYADVTSQQEEVEVEDSYELVSEEAFKQANEAGFLMNSRRKPPARSKISFSAIKMRNAFIDAEYAAQTGKSIEVPQEWRAPEDTQLRIVAFDHILGKADREFLESEGFEISHYVPSTAYAVWGTPEQFAALDGSGGVLHVEPYHPYFKLSKDLMDYFVKDPKNDPAGTMLEGGKFNLLAYGMDEDALTELIEAEGGKVESITPISGRVKVTASEIEPEEIASLVRHDTVQWAEVDYPRTVMNDLGRHKIRADDLQALHPELTGQGVVINVTDSGLDVGHSGFALDPNLPTSTGQNTRIKFYIAEPSVTTDGLIGDNNGHGSHVSGTILGNGALSSTALKVPGSEIFPFAPFNFRGSAPDAQIVMIEDFNAFTDEEQAQIAYNQGARISNNSWGNSNDDYGLLSMIWDGLVRDADPDAIGNQEYIAFFAAGNSGGADYDGTGGTLDTVGEPGNAKNVISIGALENKRHAENLVNVFIGNLEFRSDLRTDTDWQVANFSSRGPVRQDSETEVFGLDDRIKPDLVAPGAFVNSIQSKDTLPDEYGEDISFTDNRYGNVDTGTNYAMFSGTSMATPMAAGGAALVYQFLTNYEGFAKSPSPAMMKAALAAGARNINSIVYPYTTHFDVWSPSDTIVHQGHGMIDVTRTVDGAGTRLGGNVYFLDQDDTTPLDTGEFWTFPIVVKKNEGGLRISLAWTDEPATPSGAQTIVNDLDLRVLAPGGRFFQGNIWDVTGANSYDSGSLDPGLGDLYNNLETIVIPPGPPGTYSIQVYGYSIPSGPQDFAVCVIPGIGHEGRLEGFEQDITFSDDGNPVVAYSVDLSKDTPASSNLTRQIVVKKWQGLVGTTNEFGEWKRLDDQWFGYGKSEDPFFGVSRSIANSRHPSVDEHDGDIFLAWQEDPQETLVPTNVSYIYLKKYDTDAEAWLEYGNSGRGTGVAGPSQYDALEPVVGVGADGLPVVAWRQNIDAINIGIKVAKWWPSSNMWLSMEGSTNYAVPGGTIASEFDMTVGWVTPIGTNTFGGRNFPIVSWTDLSNQKIKTRRWNGINWESPADVGASPIVVTPSLAATDDGSIYLAYQQLPDGIGGKVSPEIFVQRFNGSWSGFGGSATYPGVSASTNDFSLSPQFPDIALNQNTNVYVTWSQGTNDVRGALLLDGTNAITQLGVENNSIAVKTYNSSLGTWEGVNRAGSVPGIIRLTGHSQKPKIAVSELGLPVVAFEATDSGIYETMVYASIQETDRPIFDGIQQAIGGTNGDVTLKWFPAEDFSQTIIYQAYISSSSTNCGAVPNCDADDVYNNPIASTTNATQITITGLTPDQVYCFGVRAIDQVGLQSTNRNLLFAGPSSASTDADGDCLIGSAELAAGTDPCVIDTDQDGMWDGWEWQFSTNNPVHVADVDAVTSMDPLDNGQENYGTTAFMDGNLAQSAYFDADNDGISSFDEFNWWYQYAQTSLASLCDGTYTNSPDPTKYDSDGDGMPDGFEIFNGLNPVVDDANGDLDQDGLINIFEYQGGSNPNNPIGSFADSDNDGLSDSNEFLNIRTSPGLADTDGDGLSDNLEISLGYSPTNASSAATLGGLLSDGDAFQLGYTAPPVANVYNFLFQEDFETGSPTLASWTTRSLNQFLPFDFWHVTSTDPAPAENPINSTNHPIVLLHQHSDSQSYRMANDTSGPPGTNVSATYNIGSPLAMALESPAINATTVSTLYVAWNEYFVTEPQHDQVQVQARSGTDTNWVRISDPLSGNSSADNSLSNVVASWVHRTADISRFAGEDNVQVRFVFTALNAINNEFPGWWVDDVVIYEAAAVTGWVRDVNGRVIVGAVVEAMGRGGVTNIIHGHSYVPSGKVLGRALTLQDGSFYMGGLPWGTAYFKGSSPLHIDEFFNGQLFTPPYGFGQGLNPGVKTFAQAVAGGGAVSLSQGSVAEVHFELGMGSGVGSLGVTLPNLDGARYKVSIDEMDAMVWNGLTGTGVVQTILETNYLYCVTNSTTNVSFEITTTLVYQANYTNYTTLASANLADNSPDWVNNPVMPTLFNGVAPGTYTVYPAADPISGTNLDVKTEYVYDQCSASIVSAEIVTNEILQYDRSFPLPEVQVREGEVSIVHVATNQPDGGLTLQAGDRGSYGVVIDGRPIGSNTPVTLRLGAGPHTVSLVSTGSMQLAAIHVEVPVGTLSFEEYPEESLHGQPGGVEITTTDLNGNVLTGASIYVDGIFATNVPAVIQNLGPGLHEVVALQDGYQQVVRGLTIYEGETNMFNMVMFQADRDYDLVGDATEIDGYGNEFLYHREEDPDADGLNNITEFEQFNRFNVRLNTFEADSDGDGLSDGNELGYDGNSNTLALTILATNAIQEADEVRTLFVGDYLSSTSHFSLVSPAVGVECDRFVAATMAPNSPAVPTENPALNLFTSIPDSPSSVAVTEGHNNGSETLADGLPDREDTDGDGMWDGFEFLYGAGTVAGLDLIECAKANDDPDFDGLSNYEEFLGPDGIANTNDWLNPGTSDTDGDGMPDGYEISYGLNPLADDRYEDEDGDGLLNIVEWLAGSNPQREDTDLDGLSDFDEVIIYGSDPNASDTDLDGLIDGQEVYDRDMDGIPDGGFFPNWAGGDLDGDGNTDGPTDWDTDGDGMPDGFEVMDGFGNIRPVGLDPFDPTDGDDDPDGDGLTSYQEYLVRDSLFGNDPASFGLQNAYWDYSSNPLNGDSDGDGMPDGFEVMNGLHPMDPVPYDTDLAEMRYLQLGPNGDLDQDGLWNMREYEVRFHLDDAATTNELFSQSTHPYIPDTDGDGLLDGEEDRAFAVNPIVQDSDRDRLADGMSVPNRFGEINTGALGTNHDYLVVDCGGCTWEEAVTAASGTEHPTFAGLFGHLVTITDAGEQSTVAVQVAANTLTNLAIGALNDFNVLFRTNEPGTGVVFEVIQPEEFTWYNFEIFTYTNFATGEPVVSNTIPAVLAMNSNGEWFAQLWYTNDIVMEVVTNSGNVITNIIEEPHITLHDGYIVEWDNLPDAAPNSNHYDQAMSDLWVLEWPSGPFPTWTKNETVEGTPPSARWGAAASYVPVYETKTPRDGDGVNPFLDNRQMVLFGGRDGVARHSDIWELRIRSNNWAWFNSPNNLAAALYQDGLSEFSAFTRLSYKNSVPPEPCRGSSLWNVNGTDFNLPKQRPWAEGPESRTWDLTFIWGGWDNKEAYYRDWIDFYKSHDDDRAIRETTNAIASHVEALGYDTNGAAFFDEVIEYELLQYIGVANNIQLDDDDDEEGLTGFSAQHFENFNIHTECEVYTNIQLRIQVSGNFAAGDIPVDIYLEYSQNDNFSLGDGVPPSSRLNGTPVSTVIPAGFTGELLIDVTPLFDGLDLEYQDLVFVFDASGAADGDYARILIAAEVNGGQSGRSFVDIDRFPAWRVAAEWYYASAVSVLSPTNALATGVRGTEVEADRFNELHRRKSHAMSYDYADGEAVLFGGINGNDILGDTWIFTGASAWQRIDTFEQPPARWGHSLVYDPEWDAHILFGGFDINHQPLNDLWISTGNETLTVVSSNETDGLVTNTYEIPLNWYEITAFTDGEIPPARGGHNMIYFGGFDFDRGFPDRYNVGGGSGLVLFGGTDNRTYFNDMYVLQLSPDAATGIEARWVLANQQGEGSLTPPPRAFATLVYGQNIGGTWIDNPVNRGASPAALLFGGRSGTLPSGMDTDQDLVYDGHEHELGGVTNGRDPRVNALIQPDDDEETLPFTFKRLGAVDGLNGVPGRKVVATFESLKNAEGYAYANAAGLPWEREYDPQIGFNSLVTPYQTVGIEGERTDLIYLWYHQHGLEDPFNEKDEWERGQPDNSVIGEKGAPPYAYSGRWVYGTDLDGRYPNGAVMELFSPIFSLKIPSSAAAGDTSDGNYNSWNLVFHEWLDLNDSNDIVRVELIRPETNADILNRKTGTTRPVRTVVGPRNDAYNTTGEWRRIIAPLDVAANETNLYLRFVLQSDTNGTAGGWYLDDVAIVQGGEISGVANAGASVELSGINPNLNILATNDADNAGNYSFGLLPYGSYSVINGTNSTTVTIVDTNPVVIPLPIPETVLPPPFPAAIARGATPNMISWGADVGATYQVQCTEDNLSGTNWSNVGGTVTAVSTNEFIIDSSGDPWRTYRILLISP